MVACPDHILESTEEIEMKVYCITISAISCRQTAFGEHHLLSEILLYCYTWNRRTENYQR